MADLLHVIGEALSAYWLSPLPLTVLAVSIASIGTLLYVFVTNARSPKLRVSLLTGLYALSIFFWAFVATSLVLCASQARMVAYARNGVSLAVFGAVFAGLATTSIVSLLVWRYGNAAVTRTGRVMAAAIRGPHRKVRGCASSDCSHCGITRCTGHGGGRSGSNHPGFDRAARAS